VARAAGGLAALAISLALFGVPPAPAQPRDEVAALGRELVYGGDAEFPPYEYLDAQGRPAGLNVELVRAIARRERLQVRIELLPWAQVRAGLRDGSLDLAAMYRSDRRQREVDFAVAHELVYHEMFVARGGGTALRSLADLAGRRVAVQRETRGAEAVAELVPAPTVTLVDSEPDALRALAAGEVEVALVSQAVGRPFVEREALAARVAVTGPPVLLTEYAFVTARGRPALLDRVNQGIQGVKSSGEYDRLYDRWIRPDRSAERLRLAAWALAAAGALVLGIVAWNRTLRRKVTLQTEALRREYEERGKVQAALAQREVALKQAGRMEAIGRLAGGVAHDFNNIVTVIVSHASMLREDLAGRPEAQEAEGILAASDRAKRLTRQILALSRESPVETEPVDLGALAQGMARMLERLAGEGVRVEVAVPPAPLVVEAAPTHLEQILLNLASNGRDAMPSGGRLTVSVDALDAAAARAPGFDPGPCAALSVTDTGTGMDPATQARIFEPFFTTKDIGRGTGLGLATVFANVHRLSGRIVVKSSPGEGSTFTVIIPLAGAAHAQASAAAGGATLRLEGLRVLLADDDDAVRHAARRILAAAGAEVLAAADGEEARAAASSGPRPNVLVTDVIMPRGGGPALAAELRGRWPDLAVLYVSGHVDEDAHLDLATPGTGFLAKPFAPAALVGAVARLTGRASGR